MKRTMVRALRRTGLLKPADNVRCWIRQFQSHSANRRFQREHPGFPVPPADLAFDALNYVNWDLYREQGGRHARVFAGKILDMTSQGPLEVLEWGCGPGRLIRHMPELLAARGARIHGADYNERSIDWCRANLPGIEFVTNALAPPLPLPDDRFDVVYNFSVFTHLSEAAQLAWAAELRRVLRPGGLLICTTHGERYAKLLAGDDERRRFERGEIVVQGGYEEGRKLFLSVHPERWVRESLFRGYEDVRLDTNAPEPDLTQDIWTARKPSA